MEKTETETETEALPLFVSRVENGTLVLGNELADRTNGDELLLRNAIKGRIVTSSVFPLVWIDDRPLRGVEYLRILTPAQIEALCDTELQIVGASLRDLVYLHTTHSKASLPDCLDDVEDVIKTAGKALSSRPEYLFEVQGLLVAPWPTKTHSLLRWIPTAITGDYASEELFVGNKEFDTRRDQEILLFRVKKPCSELLNLARWTCCAPPFNQEQRGGGRLLFRSETLAARLTEALKERIDVELVTVNYVFLLNKFGPDDALFESHYDVPYYDSINRCRSKYTLLLYLTAGSSADPLLRVENLGFTRLEALQGVIFSQRYEHEGKPYETGDKVFLRSELICDLSGEEDEQDMEVARMFNVACYHAVHQDTQLQEYATQLFNLSVACRFNEMTLPDYRMVFRRVGGIPYVTTGHDYWFSSYTTLRKAAVLCLLDYFQGTYRLKKFRQLLEETSVLEGDFRCDDDLAIVCYVMYSFPPEDWEMYFSLKCFEDLHPSTCKCPVCCRECGKKLCSCPVEENATNVEKFNVYAGPARETLEQYSLAIFDGSIRINTADMVVTDTEIRFGTTGFQDRVWFANCPCNCYEYPVNYVENVQYEDARLFHLPPIKYKDIEGLGYHLIVDMFESGWVDRTLNIPKFHEQVDTVPRTTDDPK